jgi:hypothetical protein
MIGQANGRSSRLGQGAESSSINLATGGVKPYRGDMARIVLTVVGVILALWLIFGFVIPALFATLKFLLVFALIALVVVVAITVVGKMSR